MRKGFVPLALTLAALYLTLSVSAAVCLFAHETEPRSSHHHTDGSTQSSLCAWACHANPTIDLVSITPQTKPFHLESILLTADSSVSFFLSQQSTQSRAPPRS